MLQDQLGLRWRWKVEVAVVVAVAVVVVMVVLGWKTMHRCSSFPMCVGTVVWTTTTRNGVLSDLAGRWEASCECGRDKCTECGMCGIRLSDSHIFRM